MSALIFRLRERPPQRLDLSLLTPERLGELTVGEIEKIELQTTRETLCVGDVFEVGGSAADDIRFEGGSDRLDRVGEGLTRGRILVEGDVGQKAGRAMRGGNLLIVGNTGRLAGSSMHGGRIEIHGDASDFLGGPFPGETAGMEGGSIVVRGHAGERAGDRMRRGLIVVERDAGAFLASRMIGGTIIVRGDAGASPGTLMARGTILVEGRLESLSPTFVDSGPHDLVALRVLERWLAAERITAAASVFRNPMRRFMGDTAVLGKGEMLVAAAPA